MVTKKLFGVAKDGLEVYAYTIANGRGIAVTVLDYGATLQSVVLPHKGERVDVVLGYDTIEAYEQNDGYLGASVGRFAGRIPDSILRIGDQAFSVTPNEGKNQLHGGIAGFDKRVWHAEAGGDSVTFSLFSPDGEEGYPGNLRCAASYTLNDDALTLVYRGESDRTTAWNPTNHAYWNLNGHDAGDARKHLLEIPADRYVPVGPDMIASEGEADVAGTRFDFRTLREIGDAYDNSFVLSGSPVRLRGNGGVGMEIETDCKAVQFYSTKFLGKRNGKDGAQYGPFGAICLETEGRQIQRNASVCEESILYANEPKTHTTRIRFLFE
ncbi:MAG: galactose mutarotase [Clostridia bacterium]|nr:galactose mutarotase [Clostridia bacterium]